MGINTRKADFINSLESPDAKDEFNRIATGIAPFEIQFGKDLAEFKRAEVIQAINSLEPTNPHTIKQSLNRIWQYQQFVDCVDASLIPPITKDEIDIVAGIRKHFFTSFDDVLNELQKVRNTTDGFIEPPLLGLAWTGLSPKEAGALLANQVDLVGGTITIERKNKVTKIDLEPSVLRVLRIFRNTSIAYRNTGKDFEVTAEDSPYFLRRLLSRNSKKKPKAYSQNDIARVISDLKAAAENNTIKLNLTYKDVKRSGELHRIYELEKSGVSIGNKEGYEKICKIAGISVNHVSDLIYQYKKYKQAFNLH